MTWREIEMGRDRFRYRRREGYEDATHGHAYEVEFWHRTDQDWHTLTSPSLRDWFALGYLAGSQAAEVTP